MTKLNDRQRLFAQHLVSGMAAGRAYEKAGYDARGHVADSAAERLLSNVDVAKHIEELRAESRQSSRIDKARAIEILCDIIETPIGEIDKDHMLAQEYQGPTEHAGAKIKMPAKMDAIRELAKMLGFYAPEKVAVGVTSDLASLMAELRERKS